MMVIRSEMTSYKDKYGKQAHRGNTVECVFHGAVAEFVPLQHAVNTQYDIEWVRTTSVPSLGIDGFDDRQHLYHGGIASMRAKNIFLRRMPLN